MAARFELTEVRSFLIFDVQGWYEDSRDAKEKISKTHSISKLFQEAHFAFVPTLTLSSPHQRLYTYLSCEDLSDEEEEAEELKIDEYRCEGFLVVDTANEGDAVAVTQMQFGEDNERGLVLMLGTLKNLQELGKKELLFPISSWEGPARLLTFVRTSKGRDLASDWIGQQQVLVQGPEQGSYKVSLATLEDN